MMNATRIFNDHIRHKQSQQATLRRKLDALTRTITAATAAARSAREAGNTADSDRYTAEADKAQKAKEKAQKTLEAISKPVPDEECRAAWIEHSARIKYALETETTEYRNARKAQAKGLLHILKAYEKLRMERNQYAAACRRPEHSQAYLEELLPVFSIDAETALSDLLFYRYTGDIAEAEADHYTALLYDVLEDH